MYVVIWLPKLRLGVPSIRSLYFVKAIKAIVNLDNIIARDVMDDKAVLAKKIDKMP